MDGLGLFGGTFNPVHRGHLQVAAEVRQRFGLHRVYLVPAAVPPHKPYDDLAASDERLAMLHLAVAGNGALAVSDIELRRPGPSYTIDTLRHFRRRIGRQSLFFILGADAFFEIDTWRDYRLLMREASFIVMNRPGTESGPERMLRFLHERVAPGFAFCPSHDRFVHATYQPVCPCSVAPVAVSSTEVRAAVRSESELLALVPAAVADYIQARGLYR